MLHDLLLFTLCAVAGAGFDSLFGIDLASTAAAEEKIVAAIARFPMYRGGQSHAGSRSSSPTRSAASPTTAIGTVANTTATPRKTPDRERRGRQCPARCRCAFH